MEIAYLGHSAFKIKTKTGTLITDPYGKHIGFALPSVSADVITVSHRGHGDHDEISAVTGTARRPEPFVIDEPGEYEIEGISIFGYQTWHDDVEGTLRGPNTIYVIQAEDVRILHLGDLGHMLEDKLLEEIDSVDVLMVPVGGHYTINAKRAVEVVSAIDPTFILPMHYKTDAHDTKTFGALTSRDEFVKLSGLSARTVTSLSLSKLSLPEDLSEVIVFE